MALTVDEMLEIIGSFGRYQRILLGILCFIKVFVLSIAGVIATFVTAEPGWTCTKGYNHSVCNFTETITLTSNYYNARCSMPRDAWIFVDDFTSIVTEFDLVCDKSYLQSVAQSSLWPGMFIGLIFGGFTSDRFGRKIVCLFGITGIVLFSWMMVFLKPFAIFIAGRLLIGLAYGFCYSSTYIVLTEYTGKNHRAKVCITTNYFYTLGMIMVAVLGYFIRTWRYILLSAAVLATPALFLIWFIPESIRWLLLHDKEEAKKQLLKLAKCNKTVMPDTALKKPETKQQGNFRHLFCNWNIAKRTLTSWNLWFTQSLVYFGILFGSVDIGWNKYLVFGLVTLIEFPSNYASIILISKYGRRKTTILGMVFALIATVVAVAIPVGGESKVTANTIARITMVVLAKFSITAAFSVTIVWSIELFPTFIRSMGLSTSSAAATLGSFAASYVIWLIRIHPSLPFGIMGLLIFQSTILASTLTETNGQATMETMDDLKETKEDLLLTTFVEKSSTVDKIENHTT